MADPLAQTRHDLAVANRVVSLEGIIDAFGHVSMRHPTKPDRYLISHSRSPEVVEASDIYEYTLGSEPVTPLPNGIRGYGELPIHGEIYKARPDVNAVAHHHAMPFLPFCNSGEELLPLYHMGAQIGEKVPFWDSRDELRQHGAVTPEPAGPESLAVVHCRDRGYAADRPAGAFEIAEAHSQAVGHHRRAHGEAQQRLDPRRQRRIEGAERGNDQRRLVHGVPRYSAASLARVA